MELAWQGRMMPFLVSSLEAPDFRYTVSLATGAKRENGVLIAQSDICSVYKMDSQNLRVYSWNCGETDTEIILSGPEQANRYQLYVSELFAEHALKPAADNLLMYLALEEILLQRDAFLLHSSFIRYRGAGILFSAPAGTGKSTQAALWEEYREAEIINGDRAVVRKHENGFFAYGSPYAGSSQIWKNESAPLKAIILLSQGPENVIRPAQNREAIRRLFPEILVNSWNPDFMDKVTSLLDCLIRTVPIYCLSCRPDEGAVELVERTLFG